MKVANVSSDATLLVGTHEPALRMRIRIIELLKFCFKIEWRPTWLRIEKGLPTAGGRYGGIVKECSDTSITSIGDITAKNRVEFGVKDSNRFDGGAGAEIDINGLCSQPGENGANEDDGKKCFQRV